MLPSGFARTPIPQCSLPPIKKIELPQLQKKVKSTEEYNRIMSVPAQSTKLNISRCDVINGNVTVSTIVLPNVYGKKCSINSMYFSFEIQNDDVQFKPMEFDSTKTLPQHLDKKLLQETLERVAQHPAAKDFFEKNNFCQIEHIQGPQSTYWVFQLRDSQKKICFIQSSMDGKQVQVVPRRYAIDSECS